MSELGPAMATVLTQVAKLVKGLDDAAVQQLLVGDTQIRLFPKGAKVEVPLDLPGLAEQVRKIVREDQIVSLLNGDKRLGATQLKQLAGELNISVPAAAKTKGPLQLYIAQAMVAHHSRSSGGV